MVRPSIWVAVGIAASIVIGYLASCGSGGPDKDNWCTQATPTPEVPFEDRPAVDGPVEEICKGNAVEFCLKYKSQAEGRYLYDSTCVPVPAGQVVYRKFKGSYYGECKHSDLAGNVDPDLEDEDEEYGEEPERSSGD